MFYFSDTTVSYCLYMNAFPTNGILRYTLVDIFLYSNGMLHSMQ